MEYAGQVVKDGKKPATVPDETTPSPAAQPNPPQPNPPKSKMINPLETAADLYLADYVGKKLVPLLFEADFTATLPAANPAAPRLGDQDYQNAANQIGADAAAVHAVSNVESNTGGFGADGKPIIRFELQWFSQFAGSTYDRTHPYLSVQSDRDGDVYHTGTQAREYCLLFNAMILRGAKTRRFTEAIKAASWGRFQVMGFNSQTAGWATPVAFAQDMYVSEGNHLKAFIGYMTKTKPKAAAALKSHDWAGFALNYNGEDYAHYHYDTRLEAAYNALTGTRPQQNAPGRPGHRQHPQPPRH
jgi:hypothetical protein